MRTGGRRTPQQDSLDVWVLIYNEERKDAVGMFVAYEVLVKRYGSDEVPSLAQILARRMING